MRIKSPKEIGTLVNSSVPRVFIQYYMGHLSVHHKKIEVFYLSLTILYLERMKLITPLQRRIKEDIYSYQFIKLKDEIIPPHIGKALLTIDSFKRINLDIALDLMWEKTQIYKNWNIPDDILTA